MVPRVTCMTCLGHPLFESEAGRLTARVQVIDDVTHLVVWQGHFGKSHEYLLMCDYDDTGERLPWQSYRIWPKTTQ